jgi:uncharacterized membrane protein (GlpM family)
MSESSFLLHVIGAFVIGGGWVAFVTWFGEVYGSSYGGLIAGLPSTSAFSFLFIGWNQSAQIAAEATTQFPLIFSFTGVFLLSYSLLAKRKKNFSIAMLGALLIWFLGTALIALIDLRDFELSLAGCVIVLAVVYLLFRKEGKVAKSPRKSGRSVPEILFRMALGGTVVALAVIASQLAGPQVGVIPTAFPALSTSSLYVLNKRQGLEFSRAFTLPTMVTASLTLVPYSIAVRVFYPEVGIWWGTLSAYGIVLPCAIIAYFVLRPKS